MIKKIAINSILTIFGLVAALFAVELFLLAFPFPKDAIKPSYCLEYDRKTVSLYTYSVSHYAYPPRTDLPNCSSDFLVVNTSDLDGYLGNSNSATKKQTLVLGDSFAYGFGVKKEQAFASHIGAYNAGLWGNSFPNHPRVLERLLNRGKNFDVVIWVIYPPHLITVSDGGWLTQLNVSKDEHPWLYWIVENYNKSRISKVVLATLGWGVNSSDYYTPEWSLYDVLDSYAETGYMKFKKAANEIKQISAAHKIKVIPLIVPSKSQVALQLNGVKPLFKLRHKLEADFPNRRLSEILRQAGFQNDDQIILFDELIADGDKYTWYKYYWTNDAHFNEDGNRFVAKIILQKSNLD